MPTLASWGRPRRRSIAWRRGVPALLVLILAAFGGVPVEAQTPLLDVDDASGGDVLLVLDDGTLVVLGTLGTGNTPIAGDGARLMWIPGRVAFRAGTPGTTGFWDAASIGQGSAAFGTNTLASDANSFAAGFNSRATKGGAVALGNGSLADGITAFAAGLANTSTGIGSAALGRQTQATGEGALASGKLTTASGLGSLTAGENTTASVDHAVALGMSTTATGAQSLALGFSTTASGAASVAAGGADTEAAGAMSLAFGRTARATGAHGLAFGDNVVAGELATSIGHSIETTGLYSVSLGSGVQNAYDGSFAFSDATMGRYSNLVTGPNQFAVVASGGVKFYSSAVNSNGVQLAPNSSSWSSLSDANAKENFAAVDRRAMVDALADLPILEWNYIGQDPAIRHIGPTAQDFRAAFGLGADSLRIETLDTDGVLLTAVQALIHENRELRARLAHMEARLEALEKPEPR